MLDGRLVAVVLAAFLLGGALGWVIRGGSSTSAGHRGTRASTTQSATREETTTIDLGQEVASAAANHGGSGDTTGGPSALMANPQQAAKITQTYCNDLATSDSETAHRNLADAMVNLVDRYDAGGDDLARMVEEALDDVGGCP